MKTTRKNMIAAALTASLLGSALVAGPAAQAGVDNSNSLEILLPPFTPTASVKVLGKTIYTPNLTNGKVVFSYSVKGQEGWLQAATSGVWCDTDPMRPREVLKLDLLGTSGNVSANASVSGSTIDPTTGQQVNFSEANGASQAASTGDPITVLELCTS